MDTDGEREGRRERGGGGKGSPEPDTAQRGGPEEVPKWGERPPDSALDFGRSGRIATPGVRRLVPTLRPIFILRIVGLRIFESKFRNRCAKKLDGALRKSHLLCVRICLTQTPNLEILSLKIGRNSRATYTR